MGVAVSLYKHAICERTRDQREPGEHSPRLSMKNIELFDAQQAVLREKLCTGLPPQAVSQSPLPLIETETRCIRQANYVKVLNTWNTLRTS